MIGKSDGKEKINCMKILLLKKWDTKATIFLAVSIVNLISNNNVWRHYIEYSRISYIILLQGLINVTMTPKKPNGKTQVDNGT